MRSYLTILVVLLFAMPVLAADLATETGELIAAVGARIAAIGPSPTDKAEKKERKNLDKGQDALGDYVGTNDADDIKALGKGGKSIVKSKTTDAAILGEMDDLLQAFIDFALAQKGLAEDAMNALPDPADRAKIQAAIDKAEAVLTKAQGLAGNFPKAWKLILTAWKKFGAAITKAAKLLQQGGGGGGGNGAWPAALHFGYGPYSFYLANNSKKFYWMSDVIITGEITNAAGTVLASPNGVSARTTWPDLFVTDHYPGGGYDAQHIIQGEVGTDPTPLHDMFTYLTGWHESLGAYETLYFTGQVTCHVSKKDDGKSTYTKTITRDHQRF